MIVVDCFDDLNYYLHAMIRIIVMSGQRTARYMRILAKETWTEQNSSQRLLTPELIIFDSDIEQDQVLFYVMRVSFNLKLYLLKPKLNL